MCRTQNLKRALSLRLQPLIENEGGGVSRCREKYLVGWVSSGSGSDDFTDNARAGCGVHVRSETRRTRQIPGEKKKRNKN